MIREELDAGYPLSYGGQSSGGGHAFVCDGYDAQGFFHINWGWEVIVMAFLPCLCLIRTMVMMVIVIARR